MMSRKRYPQPHPRPDAEPAPELERVLCDLKSPDAKTRADAVRALCPCRGSQWNVPVFPHVLELRNDPNPVVRHAVQHDLKENPNWGGRQELRRLEGQRVRREMQHAMEEIEVEAESAMPPSHSLAWRMPRRPRQRKGHYPRQGRAGRFGGQ
jgi:hypothetical protein